MIFILESNITKKNFSRWVEKRLLAMSLIFCVGLFSGESKPALAQDKNLKIAVAANLLLPMQQIKQLYEEKFNSTLVLIPGSSGKLTTQIINGAPYDVFLSADMKYPEQIRREGHAANSPEVLLRGKLVFWSKQKPDKPLAEWLTNGKIRSIAIAQPELAPYGLRAKDWLEEMKIYDKVLPKVVFGESIGQVNQYIRSGTVDAAFTAISAMQAEAISDSGYWEPLDIYSGDPSKLDHGIVLLTNATGEKLTINQFIEFIKSPVAEKVFLDFGYQIP